jgi:hypothetical protein
MLATLGAWPLRLPVGMIRSGWICSTDPVGCGNSISGADPWFLALVYAALLYSLIRLSTTSRRLSRAWSSSAGAPQHRVQGHQQPQSHPPRLGDHTGQRGDQRPVSPSQSRPAYLLAPQYAELMTLRQVSSRGNFIPRLS